MVKYFKKLLAYLMAIAMIAGNMFYGTETTAYAGNSMFNENERYIYDGTGIFKYIDGSNMGRLNLYNKYKPGERIHAYCIDKYTGTFKNDEYRPLNIFAAFEHFSGLDKTEYARSEQFLKNVVLESDRLIAAHPEYKTDIAVAAQALIWDKLHNTDALNGKRYSCYYSGGFRAGEDLLLTIKFDNSFFDRIYSQYGKDARLTIVENRRRSYRVLYNDLLSGYKNNAKVKIFEDLGTDPYGNHYIATNRFSIYINNQPIIVNRYAQEYNKTGYLTKKEVTVSVTNTEFSSNKNAVYYYNLLKEVGLAHENDKDETAPNTDGSIYIDTNTVDVQETGNMVNISYTVNMKDVHNYNSSLADTMLTYLTRTDANGRNTGSIHPDNFKTDFVNNQWNISFTLPLSVYKSIVDNNEKITVNERVILGTKLVQKVAALVSVDNYPPKQNLITTQPVWVKNEGRCSFELPVKHEYTVTVKKQWLSNDYKDVSSEVNDDITAVLVKADKDSLLNRDEKYELIDSCKLTKANGYEAQFTKLENYNPEKYSYKVFEALKTDSAASDTVKIGNDYYRLLTGDGASSPSITINDKNYSVFYSNPVTEGNNREYTIINRLLPEKKEATLGTTVTADNTTARNGAAVIEAESPREVTVRDTITCKNFDKAEYTFRGQIYNVTDKTFVKLDNDNNISRYMTKTMKGENSEEGVMDFGNVVLEPGKTYVVFERAVKTSDNTVSKVTEGGTNIEVHLIDKKDPDSKDLEKLLLHEDPNEVTQTVVINKTVKPSSPVIGTTVMADSSGKTQSADPDGGKPLHIELQSNETVIKLDNLTDKVAYSNFEKGTYEITGELVKVDEKGNWTKELPLIENGQEISGTVTNTVKYTVTDNSSGTFDVPLYSDSKSSVSIKYEPGYKYVVFETVKAEGSSSVYAEHKKTDAPSQTVTVSKHHGPNKVYKIDSWYKAPAAGAEFKLYRVPDKSVQDYSIKLAGTSDNMNTDRLTISLVNVSPDGERELAGAAPVTFSNSLRETTVKAIVNNGDKVSLEVEYRNHDGYTVSEDSIKYNADTRTFTVTLIPEKADEIKANDAVTTTDKTIAAPEKDSEVLSEEKSNDNENLPENSEAVAEEKTAEEKATEENTLAAMPTEEKAADEKETEDKKAEDTTVSNTALNKEISEEKSAKDSKELNIDKETEAPVAENSVEKGINKVIWSQNITVENAKTVESIPVSEKPIVSDKEGLLVYDFDSLDDGEYYLVETAKPSKGDRTGEWSSTQPDRYAFEIKDGVMTAVKNGNMQQKTDGSFEIVNNWNYIKTPDKPDKPETPHTPTVPDTPTTPYYPTIPDNPTPLTPPQPDKIKPEKIVEIPDEPIVLKDGDDDTPETVIDEDVPLAGVPKTGENDMGSYLMLSMAGFALGGLLITGKKKTVKRKK